jgi:hypothetical protein
MFNLNVFTLSLNMAFSKKARSRSQRNEYCSICIKPVPVNACNIAFPRDKMCEIIFSDRMIGWFGGSIGWI